MKVITEYIVQTFGMISTNGDYDWIDVKGYNDKQDALTKMKEIEIIHGKYKTRLIIRKITIEEFETV